MRAVYREKRYICGEYLDVFIYPVFETGRRGGKRVKRNPSTAAQKKLNQKHREEKVARLLHANFTPEDLEIHLTYAVQPGSDEEAARLLRNYIRKNTAPAEKAGPAAAEIHSCYRAWKAEQTVSPPCHRQRRRGP